MHLRSARLDLHADTGIGFRSRKGAHRAPTVLRQTGTQLQGNARTGRIARADRSIGARTERADAPSFGSALYQDRTVDLKALNARRAESAAELDRLLGRWEALETKKCILRC